jgi:predicted GNAT family acetyltransferase
MNMTNENRVRHNKQTQQFEMALEEGKTAFIQYEEESEGILALAHTEVPGGIRGTGHRQCSAQRGFSDSAS